MTTRMDLIERLKERAKEKRATLIFPEGEDERVVKACALLAKEESVRPVILGDGKSIRAAAEK